MFRWLRLSALLISLLVMAGCGFLGELETRFLCFAQPPFATGVVDAAAMGPTTTDTGVPVVSDSPGDSGRIDIANSGLWWGAAPPPTALDAGSIVVQSTGFATYPANITNPAGVTTIEWEIKTWADSSGATDARIDRHSAPFNCYAPFKLVIPLQNRYLDYIKYRLKNYYGWSNLFTIAAWTYPPLAWTGTHVSTTP